VEGEVLAVLSRISTVSEMTQAFADEDRCRRLLEAMVWPRGRICPACGYRRSCSVAGRDRGRSKRPGLYQCSSATCRHQFTVTTRTPLHATKLPLRIWLTGFWLILQSDKGLSSVRLAEALGVSQRTAWRMGHALRLMMADQNPLDGIVEVDDTMVGGVPRQDLVHLHPRHGLRGKTVKFPAVVAVQRPADATPGTPAGAVRAGVVADLSEAEAVRVLGYAIDPDTHLMTDGGLGFRPFGEGFIAHDTVCHSAGEHVRGIVHVNSVEGFNDRVRRVVTGVFHHISPRHADLYFHEIGFRWSQRVVTGTANRRTRKGRQVSRTLWSRIPPALQLTTLFPRAVGRELRRTRDGSILIKSAVAAFGS
jgi:hypothetical protein